MTYTTIRPKGLKRDIVVRTELSLQRASNRAVLRTPDFKRVPMSAQDAADETWLSRSKEYPSKGKQEAERRFAREQSRLDAAESRHLQACNDFDAEKIAQEEAA